MNRFWSAALRPTATIDWDREWTRDFSLDSMTVAVMDIMARVDLSGEGRIVIVLGNGDCPD